MRTVEEITKELQARVDGNTNTEVSKILERTTKKTIAGVNFYSATDEIRVAYTICLLSENNRPIQALEKRGEFYLMRGLGRIESIDGVWYGAIEEAKAFIKSATKNLSDDDRKYKNHIACYDLFTLKAFMKAEKMVAENVKPILDLVFELSEAKTGATK